MERPQVDLQYVVGKIPVGPTFYAGQLHEVSAGMRTFRPVIDIQKCIKCLRCFLVCPDGAIDKSSSELEIDYDYCKGCGICARTCKAGAISMRKEAEV